MAYIPASHSHYNLLPRKTAHGGEVFAYYSTTELQEQLRDYKPLQGPLDPYGYSSYEEYFGMLDALTQDYSSWTEAVQAIRAFQNHIDDLNHKEKWSVCRYVGKNYGGTSGLTCGQTYYWPCSASHPRFIGMIDNEEFTNYWYPPNPKFWLIVEDPTGMAAKAMIYYQETTREKKQALLMVDL